MPAFASLLAASARAQGRVAQPVRRRISAAAGAAGRDRQRQPRRRTIPPTASLWRQAQRYPANRGELESVLGTRPTLLLSMSGGGRATSLIAERLGIRSVDLAYPATIAEVEATMVRVATALGDARRARRVAAAAGTAHADAPAPARRDLPRQRREQRLGGVARCAVDGARAATGSARCPAAAPRWKRSRPARPQVLLRSTYRRRPALARAALARPSAGAAIGGADGRDRRPAMDLCRPADGR